MIPGASAPVLAQVRVPVFVAHGSRDPVIPVDFARDAREQIEAAGLPLEYHEHPGGHQLDPRLLAPMSEWVAQRTAVPR
jgi:phospholipase/carboxylesterase